MLTEHHYYLALSTALIGAQPIQRIIEYCGSAQDAWRCGSSTLTPVLKASQIERWQHAQKTLDLEALFAQYKQQGIDIVIQSDTLYPPLLQHITDPPAILLVKGNLSALHHRTLSVVGTRRVTDYGQRVTETLMKQLKPYQPCIVSGLAAGIDSLAHQSALVNGLPTVAVFGTAINEIYPKSNTQLAQDIVANNGAIISEYPIGVPSGAFMFPQRNRIIAGLSQGTLVMEGSLKSGSLITARLALESNRYVMAVPGNIFSPAAVGCNHLIQEGAYPVQSGEDIASFMNWTALTQTENPLEENTLQPDWLNVLSPHERSVFLALSHDPVALDSLQQEVLSLSLVELQTALTMLELTGRIKALPGARFCKC